MPATRSHSRDASQALPNGNGASSSANTALTIAEDSNVDPDAPLMKSTDMPSQMQAHATASAIKAIAEARKGSPNALHNTIARILKKEFDAAYGGSWHCVVGRNFGSQVVHESKTFLYCYIGSIAILLFRSGHA